MTNKYKSQIELKETSLMSSFVYEDEDIDNFVFETALVDRGIVELLKEFILGDLEICIYYDDMFLISYPIDEIPSQEKIKEAILTSYAPYDSSRVVL